MKNLMHMSKALLKGLLLKKNLPASTRISCGLYIEEIASKRPNATMVIFEDNQITWQQFNQLSNQFADLFIQKGAKRHDCIGLLMNNCIEYLAAVIGASKIGAIAGLLNPNTKSSALTNAVNAIKPCILLIDESHIEQYALLQTEISGPMIYVGNPPIPHHPDICSFYDLQPQLNQVNPINSCPGTLYEPCFYMFTSGTTGLPKAALFQTARLLGCVEGFGKLALDMKPDDRIYLTLPLYHATGLVMSLGSLIAGQCSLVLKKGFSASQFWQDVDQYQATCFIYIGELCRYLMNQRVNRFEKNNSITKCIGNGLRPDIWHDFKKRFQIEKVIEFYGSSEGNTAFINAFNKDCTIGFCINQFELIEYDTHTDTIVRTDTGLCKPVVAGQTGLVVMKIDENAQFLGYTDNHATEEKVIHDVLIPGDRYFNSGDLLKQVNVGFCFGIKHFQFVDRLGDTFRWKGENVSTTEVSDVINQYPDILLSTVFGVILPKTDGKASMAAIKLSIDPTEFDWHQFTTFIKQSLPNYAIPQFIRILKEIPTTNTHKFIKRQLKDQAYHLDRNDDPIFVFKPEYSTYVKLDGVYYQKIMEGKGGI